VAVARVSRTASLTTHIKARGHRLKEWTHNRAFCGSKCGCLPALLSLLLSNLDVFRAGLPCIKCKFPITLYQIERRKKSLAASNAFGRAEPAKLGATSASASSTALPSGITRVSTTASRADKGKAQIKVLNRVDGSRPTPFSGSDAASAAATSAAMIAHSPPISAWGPQQSVHAAVPHLSVNASWTRGVAAAGVGRGSFALLSGLADQTEEDAFRPATPPTEQLGNATGGAVTAARAASPISASPPSSLASLSPRMRDDSSDAEDSDLALLGWTQVRKGGSRRPQLL
jgi:hypothetical protein